MPREAPAGHSRMWPSTIIRVRASCRAQGFGRKLLSGGSGALRGARREDQALDHGQQPSLPIAAVCQGLSSLKHSFTKPYRPQTNGKAQRFIAPYLRKFDAKKDVGADG